MRAAFHRGGSTVCFGALLVFAAGCGGGGGTTPPPTPVLTTLSVSLSSSSIQIGQTTPATAAGLDQNGTSISTGAVTWSSSNLVVATVSTAGVVSAVGAGQAQIVATASGKTGQATLTVTVPPVVSVTVTPPTTTISIGATTQLTAATLDASGNALTGRTVTWATSDQTKATVSATGLVTAVAAGTAVITATSEGKSGTSTITVSATPPVLTTVSVSLSSTSVQVGQTVTATAAGLDQNGSPIATGTVAWSSSNTSVATVNSAGTVSGVAVGQAQIIATAGGKTGQATITVVAPVPVCSNSTALQLSLGEVRTLTADQIASLCIGGLAAASEYVLIPFNNSNVAGLTTSISILATNTSTVTASPNVAPLSGSTLLARATPAPSADAEIAFRRRERQDVGNLRALGRVTARRAATPTPSFLTSIPANPAVGSIVQLNANVSGNTCSSAKQLHSARVVAVLPHSILFLDSQAPTPGGYTDSELIAFATSFENVGYGLDTLNFGAPTDIDGNGKVGIFFTTGVNLIPSLSAGFIGGLFASRDLVPATSCIASNEGEMFYLPVPDSLATLNANYKSKATLSNTVLGTLVHEFQHLINSGRRLYVNNALAQEEVWLNEGLSHIAEELLYYRESGNSPRINLGLADVTGTQAQIDAINTYQLQNLGRLITYFAAPSTNSPFSQVDGLEMRGAIWELLRYSADKAGGNERNLWFSLVNATSTGQTNFNAVFGDIITNTRDWAVAQFVDDTGLPVAAKYTNPSWNFRTLLPAISTPKGTFTLQTRTPVPGTPLSITLNGGGAAYVRFRVTASTLATLASTSSGVATPANIDFILVRTQ